MKSTRRLFQWIGVWVALMPFLGLPPSWKKVLAILTGIAIIVISYLYLRVQKMQKTKTDSVITEPISDVRKIV